MLIVLKGLLIGLAFVAPIGMQNIFMFNNALSNKLGRALQIALIIWFFDATFSLAMFYGVGGVLTAFDWLEILVMLVGGALVIWIGWTIIRDARNVKFGVQQTPITLKKAALTALIAVWGNPQALIDGSLMLGALRGTLKAGEDQPFILGVVLAAGLWFVGMSLLVNAIRHRLPAALLRGINYASGAVVMIYGAYLIVSAVQELI